MMIFIKSLILCLFAIVLSLSPGKTTPSQAEVSSDGLQAMLERVHPNYIDYSGEQLSHFNALKVGTAESIWLGSHNTTALSAVFQQAENYGFFKTNSEVSMHKKFPELLSVDWASSAHSRVLAVSLAMLEKIEFAAEKHLNLDLVITQLAAAGFLSQIKNEHISSDLKHKLAEHLYQRLVSGEVLDAVQVHTYSSLLLVAAVNNTFTFDGDRTSALVDSFYGRAKNSSLVVPQDAQFSDFTQMINDSAGVSHFEVLPSPRESGFLSLLAYVLDPTNSLELKSVAKDALKKRGTDSHPTRLANFIRDALSQIGKRIIQGNDMLLLNRDQGGDASSCNGMFTR